jgi:hypothetical protein
MPNVPTSYVPKYPNDLVSVESRLIMHDSSLEYALSEYTLLETRFCTGQTEI